MNTIIVPSSDVLPGAADRLMTSSNRNNDLAPAQEKMEWVTPKISLMEAENTEGKTKTSSEENLVSEIVFYAPS